jgi:hypothetical protein
MAGKKSTRLRRSARVPVDKVTSTATQRPPCNDFLRMVGHARETREEQCCGHNLSIASICAYTVRCAILLRQTLFNGRGRWDRPRSHAVAASRALSGNSVAENHLTRAKSDGVRNCLCPQARLRARVREQDGYWATQLCTSMSS